MSPKARKIYNSTNLAKGPCGGTEQGGVHFMAMPLSRNYFAWKITHPSLKGNCTLSLSTGTDEDEFKLLTPMDGSADKKGRFPCGRTVTFNEGKEVRLPNVTCDSCIIRWEWTTEAGKINMCSDI